MFRNLLPLRRGRSCAGPQILFDIILRGWDIILGPAQDEAAENTFINKKCKHTFVFLPKNKDEI